jgi:hypothetical protein
MKTNGLAAWVLIFLCTALAPSAFSQSQQVDIEELKKTAPKIYIDCEWCDIEYIKTEVTFVNYVRDRKEAQVHVLITIQPTGSGGQEYTLTFLGQLDCLGQDDVLKYFSNKTDTDDEIRKGLVQTLKVGLMRYVAKTPISKRIAVSLMDQVKPTSVIDKWNFWVFSLSGRGYFNGQQSIFYSQLYGSFSANRVTPELKIRSTVSASHYFNTFDIEGETIESTLSTQRLNGLVVKSLNEHWSAGAYLSFTSSSYSNLKLAVNPAPAVEFNLFPYSQSTRRQLRFLYRLNFSAVKYNEETLYLKTKENLWSESLTTAIELKEKWGTISTSLEAAHYFHDFSKYHLNLYAEMSLRLYKGLSLELYGYASRLHDQLSLPMQGASYEDILLMRKQLATSYEYFFFVGLSYTFGSIYSNVVNPRFGSESSFSSIY